MTYSTLVDVATVASHLDDPDWVVFDCRFALTSPLQGRGEYDQGHIPGARYADLDRDLADPKQAHTGRHPLPDPARFVEWLRGSGVNRGSQVVAYDASGSVMASRLWWMLRWLGHRDAAVLDGGWPAWVEQGYPVSTEVPRPGRGDFSGEPDRSMWLSTEEVQAIVGAAHAADMIVDARAGPRFRGEKEPIDPVAGHIPGARNRPCSDNVDDRGRFLPADRLRRDLEPLIGDREAARIVNMCGSGVSACRNILGMEIAGWPGTRLYVGSWSEWITDPTRPIETTP